MGLKQTPLVDRHRALGGRLVEFGGWEMPVQYSGILAEHNAVRSAAGLFDISHMGEVFVRGPGALDFLQRLATNDASRLAVGRAQYSILCAEDGGTVDDIYVYRLAEQNYLLIVNASRVEADVAWIREVWRRLGSDPAVEIEDASAGYGAVALQGPQSASLIDEVLGSPRVLGAGAAKASQYKKNQVGYFVFGRQIVIVARTGYTGEDGFEVVAPCAELAALWDRILDLGAKCGAKPAGLGARDTLRTEMGYPLYGHELSEQISPLEAGLERFVAFNKPEFMGRARLQEQAHAGVGRKAVAFRMTGKCPPPRPDYVLYGTGSEPVGRVTSGTSSPSLGCGIGLGLVRPEVAAPGQVLQVEIRGQRFPAEVVAKPIYRKAV